MAGHLNRYIEILDSPKKVGNNSKRLEEPQELPPIILSENSKLITLADQAPETRDVVSAYNLSNYRRRPVAVILSPDLRIEIDELIFDTRGLLDCEATL